MENNLPASVDTYSSDVSIKSEEINAHREIALANIAAQKEVSLTWNAHFWHDQKSSKIFFTIIFTLSIIFLSVLTWFGGREFLIKVLETVVPPLATAFGGYYYGKSKSKDPK